MTTAIEPKTKNRPSSGTPTVTAPDAHAAERSQQTDSSIGLQEENVYEIVRVERCEVGEFSYVSETLNEDELEAVKGFLSIYRADCGDLTPAEEFLCSLVSCHSSIRPITPKDVERELESFRLNFDDLVAAGKYFNRLYVHLVDDEPAHQEGTL